MAIGGKAIAADDGYRVSSLIDFDERDPLLVQPSQYIEGDAAGSVQHDDPRGQVSIAFEVPVGFLLLRIVGEAVAYEERPGFDPKRNAVAGQNKRIARRPSPKSPVLRTRRLMTPMCEFRFNPATDSDLMSAAIPI